MSAGTSDCSDISKKRKSGFRSLLSFFKKKKVDNSGNDAETNSEVRLLQDQSVSPPPPVAEPIPASPSTATADFNDIGLIIKKQISNSEIKIVMENPWMPDPNFHFPSSGKRNLKFKYQWMSRWNWLLYSKLEDGAFCRYCSMFSSVGGGRGSQTLGNLVKTPFKKWKDAVEQFDKHGETSYHKSNMLKSEAWASVEKGHQPSVEQQQNSALKEQILENRRAVLPIIETIMFCGRQGIALRGHRDHGDLDLAENPEHNEGNFRALLRFRSNSGDTNLKDHLETGAKNAMYLSPKTQNEIISACNDIILRKLVDMVNSAKCFTVLADESTDISTVEQLSLGVRYVYKNQIREDFLQFVPVYDVTGNGLATVILNSLEQFGVKTQYLRGQGYDGASSMSGKFKGAQACVQEKHETAIYVHCASHSLNLAISGSCTVPEIRNCCGTATKLYNFFNTPKRAEVLRRAIEEKCPNSKATRLKQMCPTRWVERHDSILLLEELLPAIYEALDEISTWEDADTSSLADQLQCAIANSSFLISLRVLAEVFSLSLPLCRALQLEDVDLLAAINMVNKLKGKIQEMRDDAKSTFCKIYSSAKQMAELVGLELTKPRLSTRQTQRCNVKVDSTEDYFRVAIFLPFLDHFGSELKTRFLKHENLLSSFMCLMPLDTQPERVTELQEKQLKKLVQFYNQDLETSENAAIGELCLWHARVKELEIGSRKAIDYLTACNEKIFPSIHKLLKILVTIPVSTSSSERTFSTLRRVKTYLRNTSGQKRINGLIMLNLHRDQTITSNEVLDHLAMTPRRLEFKLK